MIWLEVYKISLWILFSLAAGITEAYIFHHFVDTDGSANKNNSFVDEHFWFTINRLIVLLALFKLHFVIYLSLILMFPFFHDGMYYYYYNRLNPKVYKKKWKDHSNTTDAIISFTFKQRLLFFCISLLILLLYGLY